MLHLDYNSFKYIYRFLIKRQLKMEDRMKVKLMTFFCVTQKLLIFRPSFFLHNSSQSNS